MQALRGTISGAVAACVAVSAALVLASAPAASSRQEGRLLVTSASATRYAGSVERPSAALPLRGAQSITALTTKGAMLGVHAASLASTPSDRVRVVIETDDPALARSSVRSVGGRVERSAAGLVQALVTPRGATALEGKAGVNRVRPPYEQIQTGVSGEQVGGALATVWDDKGFTGKGVKIAVIDGGFKGLADRQASGDLPTSVVTQDLCSGHLLGEEDHGTAVA